MLRSLTRIVSCLVHSCLLDSLAFAQLYINSDCRSCFLLALLGAEDRGVHWTMLASKGRMTSATCLQIIQLALAMDMPSSTSGRASDDARKGVPQKAFAGCS
eukprot:3647888-Amphidinium_carterae.1